MSEDIGSSRKIDQASVKEDCATPPRQTTRYQHEGGQSSPISISSTPSNRSSPELSASKRPASPFMTSSLPNKRHQPHRHYESSQRILERSDSNQYDISYQGSLAAQNPQSPQKAQGSSSVSDVAPTIEEMFKRGKQAVNTDENQFEDQNITMALPFHSGLVFGSSPIKLNFPVEEPHTPLDRITSHSSPKTPFLALQRTPDIPVTMRDLFAPGPLPVLQRTPDTPVTTKDLVTPVVKLPVTIEPNITEGESGTLIAGKELTATNKVSNAPKAPSKPKVSKAPPKPKAREAPENLEALRQQLALQRTLEKELKGLGVSSLEDLFGDNTGEIPEEVEARLAIEKEAAQERREIQMMELMQREEEERLADMEKQKLAQEKRLANEEEDMRKKTRREEDRKKQQAADITEQNGKRRLVAERIEKARKEEENVAKEKDNGKIPRVQVEAEELSNIGGQNSLARRNLGALVPDEEKSMFVPGLTKEHRATGTLVRPQSIADVFSEHTSNISQPTSNIGESRYRNDSDGQEQEHNARNAAGLKAKLDARFKSGQSANLESFMVPRHAVNSTMSEMANIASRGRLSTQAKPREYKPRSENDIEKRRQKETAKYREKHRQQMMDEAQKDGEQLSDTELDLRLEKLMDKRQKALERRREKQRQEQKVADSALEKLAMESPLRQVQQSQPLQQSQPVHQVHQLRPALQFKPKPPQQQQSLDIAEPDIEDEPTPDDQLGMENEMVAKASMEALARRRRTAAAFNTAASMKTVSDFESESEESEEDPWDLPEPEEKLQSTDKDGELKDGNEDELDEGGINDGLDESRDALNLGLDRSMLDGPKQTPKSSRFLAEAAFLGKSVKGQKEIGSLPADKGHIYYVYEALTFDGFEKEIKGEKAYEKKQVGNSTSVTEANAIARKRLTKPRKRQTKYILEEMEDDGLVICTVVFDTEKKNQLKIWVEKVLIDSAQLSNDELDRLEVKVPPKAYTVWQCVTKEELNAETGKVYVHHQLPTAMGCFSLREIANSHACYRLCEFIKPQGKRIDEWDVWNKTSEEIRALKDQYNAGDANALFDIEVERNDDSCTWLEVSKVAYRVVPQNIYGPLN